MGRLSGSGGDSPPDDDTESTEASGLRDYVFGPILQSIDSKTGEIRDKIDQHLELTDSINNTLATFVSQATDSTRQELAPRPREYPHAFEVEVPADTNVTDPTTARFEPDYDATITNVDIEYPDGTQQAVGVQLRTAGGARWIPRGGTRSVVGSDPSEIQYVQANDRTISTALNVEIDANNPVVVELINNDPNNNHLIEITMNLEERVVGSA